MLFPSCSRPGQSRSRQDSRKGPFLSLPCCRLAPCPLHAGTFPPASVPNQSLISAREVFLLLLTNAIVFPMFSRCFPQLGSSGLAPAGASSAQTRAESASSKILLPPEFIPRAQGWAGVGNMGLVPPGGEAASPLCPSAWYWHHSALGVMSPKWCPAGDTHQSTHTRPPSSPRGMQTPLIPLHVPGMAGAGSVPCGTRPSRIAAGLLFLLACN